MNKWSVLAAVLLSALLSLPPVAQAQPSLAILYDIAGPGDLGFNDMAAIGGARAAREFAAQVTAVESATPSDFLPNLRRVADSGEHDIIVAVGFLFAQAIEQAAQEFPHQKFVLLDGEVQAPNVMSVLFAEQEGSALVGALAALAALESGSDTIGIVLGMDIPPLRRFEMGYRWGTRWAVEQYNLGIETLGSGTQRSVDILTVYTGSFDDPAAGKQAAEAQLRQGAAVVYNAAGATGLGIFEAVEEAALAAGRTTGPPFAIGVDAVQDHVKPGFIPTSMVKRLDVAVYTALERTLADTFAGETVVLDLEAGGVGLSTDALLNDLLTSAIESGSLDPAHRAEVIARVEAARAAISAHVWEKVADLERRIRTGDIELPPVPNVDEG